MNPTRVRAAVTGVMAAAVLLLGGCQGESDEPAPTPTATPTAADNAYCGLVSTELADSLLGSEVEVEARDLVTAAPDSGSLGCNIRGASDGVSYISVVADPDTGEPTPATVNTDGCTPVDVDGWGPVTACPRDDWVNVAAFPPTDGRFLSISVRLDAPGAQAKATDEQLQEMTDAAVRVAQDVDTNLDRF